MGDKIRCFRTHHGNLKELWISEFDDELPYNIIIKYSFNENKVENRIVWESDKSFYSNGEMTIKNKETKVEWIYQI